MLKLYLLSMQRLSSIEVHLMAKDELNQIREDLDAVESYLDNKWFPHVSPEGVDRKTAKKRLRSLREKFDEMTSLEEEWEVEEL